MRMSLFELPSRSLGFAPPGGGGKLKVAVTGNGPVIVRVQVPVPAQPEPLQPAKVAPPDGTAESVTAVLRAKFALHATPHEMPDGELLTMPEPVPSLTT